MVSYFFCIYILSVKVIIIIFLKVVCGIVMNIIKKWSIDFLDINAPNLPLFRATIMLTAIAVIIICLDRTTWIWLNTTANHFLIFHIKQRCFWLRIYFFIILHIIYFFCTYYFRLVISELNRLQR